MAKKTHDEINGAPVWNAEGYELWECPHCHVVYINSDYCYRCDKLEDDD